MAFGKTEDFHFEESEESFDNYRERLEQYFAANNLDTKEEKTKLVFLSVVGKRTHSLLVDLCAPDKPSEKSYKELLDLLQRHYVPKTNFIAERCKFHGRNQKDNETISEYVASLRKVAASCKFGTFLDEALRDRFVCGVKSSELRDRLLSTAHTKDLTLPLAVEMALSFEVTKDSAQQFAQKAFKAHVVGKKVKPKYREAEKNPAAGKPCYRCGGKNHNPNDCRFKESECHECKKKGHIAKACRTRKEGGCSSTTKGTIHLDLKRRPSALKQCHDVCSSPRPHKPPKGATQDADPGNRHGLKEDNQFLSHQDGAASDVVVQCKMEAAPNSDTVPDLTLDSPDVGLLEMNTASAGNRTIRGAAMAQQQQKKKKKKKKKKNTGIPDRWLDYCPVGSRIQGTRFISFKVPLKAALNCQLPASQSFDLWDLLDLVRRQNQELGLIIDLTFTTRYYSVSDIPQHCAYIKIPTQGHSVPNNGVILSFKRAVRHFLRENQDDRLIGVHCTHGLNRTGYLICRYLIDVDGLDATAALELFNSSRGHHIERKNYIRDLQHAAKRSNTGIDEPERDPIMGLGVGKKPAMVIKHEEKVENSSAAQHVRASGEESAENQSDHGHQLSMI